MVVIFLPTDKFYSVLEDAIRRVKRRPYVSDVLLENDRLRDSFCKQFKDKTVKSVIVLNLYEFRNNALVDAISNECVATYLTRLFHEEQHAYHNAVVDTRLQKTRLGKEIAAMGIVCVNFS